MWIQNDRIQFDGNLAFRHTGKSATAVCGGQSDAPRPNGPSSQQLKTSNSGWVQRETALLGSRGGRRGKNGKEAVQEYGEGARAGGAAAVHPDRCSPTHQKGQVRQVRRDRRPEYP